MIRKVIVTTLCVTVLGWLAGLAIVMAALAGYHGWGLG